MKALTHATAGLLALIFMLLSLTGCAPGLTHSDTSSPDSANTAVTPGIEADVPESTPTDGAADITVTDQAGRTVTLEKAASRVVSAYYISTALLVALDCDDSLVGIEKKAETRELYALASPGLLDLPAVGSGKGINVEQTAALEPDLVVLPTKLAESAAQFEALNIPVAIVNPETESGFEECALLLGKLCGKEQRAGELVAYYREKAEMARRLTADVTRPDVYLCAGSSYLSTCTDGMYQTELISLAGGRSVSEELPGDYWQSVSPEQLAVWNPEYIFAVNYAEYTLDDIRNDPALADLSAVRENRIYTFPSPIEAWDTPAPSSVLGVLWLINMLHPELYTTEQYAAEARTFYKTFFVIEVTDDMLGLARG